MAKEVTLTEGNFEQEVMNADMPVLVDFWAEWCMPCKMVAPVLEEIADEYAGKLKVGKLNVDSEGDIAMKYNVVSIPTILLFKDGKVVNQHIGAAPKNALENLFKDEI
ncbi:MAG: thioredoxin [Spirochaetia bacterium]